MSGTSIIAKIFVPLNSKLHPASIISSLQTNDLCRMCGGDGMRGSRKFFSGGGGGSNFKYVFSSLVERGSKYHYKRAIIGPPAKCYLNGASLVCQ